MRLFGIDPGATTGWCEYDSESRRVLSSGEFRGDDLPPDALVAAGRCEHAIIESLHEPRGGIYPAVVVAGITQGHIERQLRYGVRPYHRITRHEVKRLLTEAMLREPVVRDDKTAWQAMLAMHGGDKAAKKGGPLHGVKSHQRAALAAVVAWCFKERLR